MGIAASAVRSVEARLLLIAGRESGERPQPEIAEKVAPGAIVRKCIESLAIRGTHHIQDATATTHRISCLYRVPRSFRR